MIRRRDSRSSWRAVLVVVVGVVLAGVGAGMTRGVAGSPDDDRGASRQAAAVTLAPTGVEAAVVPARTEAGARSGVHQSPGRSLLSMVAGMIVVARLLSVAGRRSDPPVAGGQPRRARRYAIALRAPPSP